MQRSDSAQREAAKRDTRRCSTRKCEAPETAPVGPEDLNTLPTVRCIRHDETSIWTHIEGVGADDSTLFRTDLDDRRHLPGYGNQVDSLRLPVEDVVAAIRTLLKSRGRTKLSGDFRWEAARRPDDFDPALGSGQSEADNNHQGQESDSGDSGH